MDDPYPTQFPRPDSLPTEDTVYPRPFLPINSPPKSLLVPPQPSIPTRSNTSEMNSLVNLGFRLSTHLTPASFLRSTPPHTLPEPPEVDLDKAGRSKHLEQVKQALYDMRESYTQSHVRHYRSGQPLPSYPRVLWHCINRFKYGNLPIISLLQSHELRERVAEIWCFEAVNHGDSAVLNFNALQTADDWTDHARDIVHFLTHYLPSSPQEQHLPLALSCRLRDRNRFPYDGRAPAFSTCYPILHCPRIPDFALPLAIGSYVNGALNRKSSWKNREEARQLFLKSSFFKAWDPDVLDTYIAHCLYEMNGEIPSQNASYLRSSVFHRRSRQSQGLVSVGGSVEDPQALVWLRDPKTLLMFGFPVQVIW
ncbi:hypothetical protein DL96DRAFT_1709059 [Flagelloscypha sp. PMI_526]|nr:hypothetical protein DL96DRAFT_1709059 [Flagelloscypha sp. PMI_526]